jgi:hypothetical protein
MCRVVIWELGGFHIESMSSYRRSLVSNLNLAANTMAKIPSEFAIFILYSGCEGSPPKVQFQLEIGLNGHAKRSRIFSCAAASKKSKRHVF